MNNIIFLFLCIFFLKINNSFAKNEPKEKVDKKEYTEVEFHKEVSKRVQDSLKKLRRDNIMKLSEELLDKEHKLKLESLEIEKRKEQLSIYEADFEKKVKELQKEQERLIGCVSENEQQRKKRITHMVDVIAGMKPVSAAQVLSVQDVDISVEILGRLQAEKVSKIFNLMEKEVSARLQKQYMNMKK